MKHLVSSMALAAVFTASLAAAATDWDAATVNEYLSKGQSDPALKATRARLAEHPDDPQARFLHAMALADGGKIADAISNYQELARQYPRRARVWNNLGVLYARQGRLEPARDALDRAIRAVPDYATAHANLGDVYVALAHQAYGRAEQQGTEAKAMQHRRNELEQLVPALPSAAATGAVAGGATTGPDTTAVRQAIDKLLSRWVQARSDQNLSAYLAVYSNDYQPHGDITRAQWIRKQRARIGESKAAAVSVSDVQVTAESADRARATFQAHYDRSGEDRETTRHMLFVREDGAWRIRRES